MTARESILRSVRANQPALRTLPVVPKFHSEQPLDLATRFVQSLKKMAGEGVTDYPADLDAFLRARFPAATRFCSTVPEFKGTCTPANFAHWSDASDIDVTVVRSPLGGRRNRIRAAS